MTLKIRELIERLESIEKIVSGSPHPNIDSVKFRLNFDDPNLDDLDWDVEVDLITFNNRIGCGCEENCIIYLNVKED
jgi:hypothetical protein